MEAQLARWRKLIAAGERRIGWKIGINLPAIQAQLGIPEPVTGYLTSAGELQPGASHSLTGGTRVGVEPEIAVRIGSDVPPNADVETAAEAIESLAPAIELVDVHLPFEDLTAILSCNIFHRAVLLGAPAPATGLSDLGRVRARVIRNGHEEASAEHEPAAEIVDLVRLVARTLALYGEGLVTGDVVITGVLTTVVWVKPGDRVEMAVQPLGELELSFTD
jgi:2-keto-4-pentenoate hydratase